MYWAAIRDVHQSPALCVIEWASQRQHSVKVVAAIQAAMIHVDLDLLQRPLFAIGIHPQSD